jgi:hypothetical protein
MGQATAPPLWVDFDRRITLEFHGARIPSDGGLLVYRELEDAFGLTDIAITQLLEDRRGKNARRAVSAVNVWAARRIRGRQRARIVRHGRYVVFQLAEVAVPRSLFADILRRITHLRPKPSPLPA